MPYALFEGPNGRPTVPKCNANGEVFVANGGGGGDATLAEQQVQSGLLTTLANAADVPTSDVVAAIEALGATATIADVVGLLTTDATTQTNILAKLTAIEIDTTATVSSLSTLVSQTDDIEPRMIDGSQRTRITDGTNNVAVTNAEPSTTSYGVVVRQAPTFAPGKTIHAQTSAGVTNAANKLLFGFTNNTGSTLHLLGAHISNTQTAAIAGVWCQINVQVSASAITGGTTITTISSPALVAACRDVRNAVPAGITWNSAGTIASPSTLESVRWSTDEVQPNGGGSMPELIFAAGFNGDAFDFSDDPVVIPNGYSCAVVCDAAATNGQTLVDFNIAQEA